MAYKDLKTIFHQSSHEADRVFQARLSDETTMTFSIGEKPFFFLMVPDVYTRLLKIERLDRQVNEKADSIPLSAVRHYIVECMIDEIILTNDIEGVVSTRKQIEHALIKLAQNDKRVRFQGIVNKYTSLANGDTIPLSTCADIRHLYDDLVLDEVIREDSSKAPDGKLFRTDSVRVIDAAQRIIHENGFSEKTIIEELTKALELFDNNHIEPAVQVALFHFIFSYIHPFYDGNGRTNRFISSYMLSQNTSGYAGIRLSFSVKENINKYYKSFKLAEHPLNKGDLTPFVITFLDIIIDALAMTLDAFNEKNALLEASIEKFKAKYGTSVPGEISSLAKTLMENTLFTERGVTSEQLAEDAEISKPTAHKRLNEIKKLGLINRVKFGKCVYYSIDLNELD